MKNMIFTAEAQKILFRFLLSCCHPLISPTKARRRHENYLASFVKKDADVFLENYLKGLGNIPVLYDKLMEVVHELGKERIDKQTVCEYFGSETHLKKVIHDLDDKDAAQYLTDCARAKFLLLHVAVLVRVMKVEIKEERMAISGMYQGIRISDLAVFKEDVPKIVMGGCVLSHFAMVVDPCPSDDLAKSLSEEQKKCANFSEIVASLKNKEIINDGLFHLTAKAMNEYEI
jgi:hypothetical protein